MSVPNPPPTPRTNQPDEAAGILRRIPALACPNCHDRLQAGDGVLRCPQCRAEYPVLDGIPSFVERDPHSQPPPTLPSPRRGEGNASEASEGKRQLSVVIPALNEASNLERLLPNLRQELEAIGLDAELIVVDGGSTDGSDAIANRLGAQFVRQTQPGYGGALREGFARARGEYLLTLDADGSHDPGFIRTMWAARDRAEVIIASRYTSGGSADMPRSRRVLSQVLNAVFRRGLALPYADLSSGYRLYRRRALQAITLTATDFDVLEEILIRCVAAGYTVAEVPFHYGARGAGKSHARLAQFAISYLKTLGKMWRLRNSIASADYDARAYDSVVPLQRYWQRRRYAVITQLAAGSKQVLDVGCGSSRIIGSGQLVGLDIVLGKLRYARRYGNPLVHGSIFNLPFADSSFDTVICSEVIEHIPAEERVFSELERVLVPGGRLILGTPDYDRWRWRALEWLYGRLSPGGYADEHITHYSQRNLAAYLQGRGMTIESIEYVAGSEMIFSLRTSATRPVATTLPVESGLRRVRQANVTTMK